LNEIAIFGGGKWGTSAEVQDSFTFGMMQKSLWKLTLELQ
jgi:hypothetical protein